MTVFKADENKIMFHDSITLAGKEYRDITDNTVVSPGSITSTCIYSMFMV